MNYNPVELILKKREGHELTPSEIDFFIQNFVKGEIPDYQMSAMLMCIFFRGASSEEISALTGSYIKSGKSIEFPADLPVADKHSTGGVGDKLSLMLAPISAALGLYVPMISGRGLGHTGGTLDKLESIPGFRTEYEIDEFKELVLKYGYALVGQSDELVPADKMIYALRDVTASVESPALITASIMSKKIAEGAKYLVIDLKIGSGAFMPDIHKARELAAHLKATGESFGQKVKIVFTNMNSPLGHAVGNALETIEAIEFLKGNTLPDNYEITLMLVSQMLILSGLAESLEEAKEMFDRVIADGSALKEFEKIIRIQGGNPEVIRDYSLFPTAKYESPVIAEKSGYIHEIDSRKIGYSLVRIKAGRMKTSDSLDYSSGAILPKKIGDEITAGESLGKVLSNDQALGDEVARMIAESYLILPEKKEKESLILEIL